MKILALTDIHGEYEQVENILTQEGDYEAVIIAGDLTTHGTVSEATKAIQAFQRFGKPVLAIAGNMDLPACDAEYERLGVDINARGLIVGGAGFFGIAGSPFTLMHTPYELSEEEILSRAEAGWRDVQTARWRVFVPHAPPYYTKLDRIQMGAHVGSRSVREFIKLHQPDVVVCGHIHESRGVDQLGRTRMVNCGPAGSGYYALIELGEEVIIELRG